ncbi:MAG: RNA polymerase sigma factor [Solirubrobacteraceae bacterium]
MTVTLNYSNKPAAARGRLSDDRVRELVRSAAAGDERGWDALVREFSGLVWGVARAHRLQHADAADVAQATWLQLLEHLDDVADPARVGAWLATTAYRESLRVLRGAARLIPSEDRAAEQEAPDEPAVEALLTSERDAALWRSFSCLRPSDQALLRLLVADPRPSYEEISAALDMPIGSIGPTRERALQRLRRKLDSDRVGEESGWR